MVTQYKLLDQRYATHEWGEPKGVNYTDSMIKSTLLMDITYVKDDSCKLFYCLLCLVE